VTPIGWIGWFERQIGAAGFQDGQEADDHLERALGENADGCVGAHSKPAQAIGEFVRAAVQFAVGKRFVLANDRDRIWGSSHLYLN
jgi:hypothetical protein